MTNEHHITWMGSFSEHAWVIKWLEPNEKPIRNLRIEDHGGVYEYCNLHGLWKLDK
jgi:superoxide reductase